MAVNTFKVKALLQLYIGKSSRKTDNKTNIVAVNFIDSVNRSTRR